MELSVVVPVHDEEAVLPELSRRLLAVLAECPGLEDYEVLFIDDGSRDGSASFLSGVAQEEPRIRLLSHERRNGQCAALKTGFDNARFAHCLTLDADLQVYPEEIPLFVREAARAEVVNGWRQNRQDVWVIERSSKTFNLLCRMLLASRFQDAASNFTLFPTAYVRYLPLIENDHRYLLFVAEMRRHGCVREIPIRHAPRISGRSKYPRFKAVGGIVEFLGFYRRRNQFVQLALE